MIARGIVELLIIAVGVVIGLALDRWMTNIDEISQADRLTERLLADIRADSTALEEQLRAFERNSGRLLQVLDVIADPRADAEDPTAFIRVIELTSWWAPLNANTSTWDEINSTGQLGLFEPEVRSALARYHQSLAYYAGIEARWGPAFSEYWSLQQPALPPLLRIAVVDQTMGGQRAREVTYDEVAPVLAAFREDDALHGALGRLAALFRYGGQPVQEVSAAASVAIAALEDR
jgi:hypothetical protein